jgi:hypothetical protein
VDLVELMGKESRMPCFSSGVAYATTQLRQRFQLHLSEAEAGTFVDDVLIRGSLGSYSTRMVGYLFSDIKLVSDTDQFSPNSTTNFSTYHREFIKVASYWYFFVYCNAFLRPFFILV